MKTIKLFLLLFATISISGQCLAQDDLPYRHFEAFKKDTIRYLDYNFTIRSDQYTDMTVGELLNDLEFPVIYVNKLAMQTSNSGDKALDGLVVMNLVIRLVGIGDWDDSKDYFIKIVLKNPVNPEDFADALSKDKRNSGRNNLFYCTPQLCELLKDRKIKWIESNYRLFKDRKRLLEINTLESIEQLKNILEAEKANWQKIIREEKKAVLK